MPERRQQIRMPMSDESTNPKSEHKPGVLKYEEGESQLDFRLHLIHFSKSKFTETTFEELNPLFDALGKTGNYWINIDGIHHQDEVNRICEHFGIHPLVIEDIQNRQHRPKCDVYPTYIFVTLRMLGLSGSRQSNIVNEQVSFVMGDNWVLSFQVRQGDVFDKVRERLRSGQSKILVSGPDYLMCRLMDVIVDNYFYITEAIREKIEKLETLAYEEHGPEFVKKVQIQKKELIFLRRSISPLRDVMLNLKSDEASHLVKSTTANYFSNVYDHVIQANETIDTQREFLATVMDLYLSQVSNRMNQVMQLLTTIATIFIPLTFIVGVYGMNFDHMPELHWKYAYFVVWGIMILVTLIMLRFFRKRNWI